MEAARQNRLNELYSDSWMSRLKAYVSRRYNDFGDWEGWFEEAHQNLALKIDKMPLEQELSFQERTDFSKTKSFRLPETAKMAAAVQCTGAGFVRVDVPATLIAR